MFKIPTGTTTENTNKQQLKQIVKIEQIQVAATNTNMQRPILAIK